MYETWRGRTDEEIRLRLSEIDGKLSELMRTIDQSTRRAHQRRVDPILEQRS